MILSNLHISKNQKKDCIFINLCLGGCIFKNLKNNKINIECKFKFYKKMNTLIFLNDIYKNSNFIFEEEVKNVKYFQIDN